MNHLRCLFFIFFGLLLSSTGKAEGPQQVVLLQDFSAKEFQHLSTGPGPAAAFLKKYARLSKKAHAAIYAFPFPFGIVGLHRIYLGCAPYVPVVYIASFGGIFGLLPLIDFVVILCDQDIEHYANSGKVFMWVE